MIDTKTVQRRAVEFATLDDALADAARIADAARAGKLEQLGNWTPGQAFGHLATWISFAYDGYPFQPPLVMSLLARLFKRKLINGKMSGGMRIPKIEGGTLGREILPLEEGLARFVTAATRLKNEPPVKPNPLFGPLTHAEWQTLHTRHAELHLSFFKY